MDRYCWFCGQKISETYGFTVKCPNGHVWHTDGADTPDDPLVLVYGWGETDTGKPSEPLGCCPCEDELERHHPAWDCPR